MIITFREYIQKSKDLDQKEELVRKQRKELERQGFELFYQLLSRGGGEVKTKRIINTDID